MKLDAQQASASGIAMARDVNGFPKLNKEAAIKFWPMLDIDDKEFLKEKYSLDLEI